jgi:hypothetical protein
MTDGRRRSVALALGLVAWAGAARAEASAPPDDRTLLVLAVALACDGGAGARPAAELEPASGAPAPEVELVARVGAKAVGFVEVPGPELVGAPALARRIACTREMTNLPARPVPGIVYEAVEIRLTIRGAPEDVAALLAAARGAADRVLLVTPTR